MRAIADAGFLVAFANDRDLHHRWAVSLASGVNEPLLTCESVLSEAAFQIGSSVVIFEMIESGLVRPAFDITVHISRLAKLAERYRDRKPDLADLCLIRMSELHPKLPIITTDVKDFRVYRRNRREAIPLIVPGDIQ